MFYVSQKCHYFHFKYSLFLREFVYLKDYLFYLPTYLAFLFLFISSWKYKPPSGVLFPGELHLNFSHGRSAGNNFSVFQCENVSTAPSFLKNSVGCLHGHDVPPSPPFHWCWQKVSRHPYARSQVFNMSSWSGCFYYFR